MTGIIDSVGERGANKEADVLIVQQLLNAHVEALGLERLREDGDIGIRTIGAIRKYQAHVVGMAKPDGRVDVGGRTWNALAGAVAPPRPAPRPSGKARWVWDQSSGTMAWDGNVFARGYAGKGAGKNNPAMQGVKKTGPIPRGLWRMTDVTASKGPVTIVLEPEGHTNTLGRSAFRIHGDNRQGNFSASEGCIILPKPARKEIWARRAESPLVEVVE
jgi:hypothetical protein